MFGCRKRGGGVPGDRHFSNRRSRLGTLPKKQIKPRVQLYCKTLINTHFPPQNFTNLQMVQNVNKHIRPSIFKASPTVSNFSFKSPFLRFGTKRSRVQISSPRPLLKRRESSTYSRSQADGRCLRTTKFDKTRFRKLSAETWRAESAKGASRSVDFLHCSLQAGGASGHSRLWRSRDASCKRPEIFQLQQVICSCSIWRLRRGIAKGTLRACV